MSQKKVTIQRPKAVTPESWVKNAPETAPEVDTKRLTLDIPAELHRRIKMACAAKDRLMSDVLRDILEDAFPRGGKS
jgi:hypothetical protein